MKLPVCSEQRMIDCRIIKELSGADFDRLRKLYIETAWISPDDPAVFLHRAVAGSTAAVGAFDDSGTLIGFGRALSDGCSDAYIQDVVVSPEFRGQGLGRQIIRLLESELRRMGVDWIGLVGEPGTEQFYSKLGLKPKSGYTLWLFSDGE